MKPRDLASLLVLSALWGGSFLFIRLAVPVLGPVSLVAFRVLLAGTTLLAYGRLRGQPLHLASRWRQYLVVGALGSAIPFVLISTAELRLTASLAAILNATTPLYGALAASVWLGERLTLRKIGGLALGLVGVAVLVGWSPLPLTAPVLLSVGASLLAAAFYGGSSVYTKIKTRSMEPLALATGSQLGAAVLLLPLVPFAPPRHEPSGLVVASALALSLLCTAVAYLLFFRLIANVGPTGALTVTYLAPVFGTTWGVLLLAEPVGWSTLAGALLILASVAAVTGVRPMRLRTLGAAPRRPA